MRPAKLRQASAYYRLAAKADRAGNYRQGTQYRNTADRLVTANRRDQEAAARARALRATAIRPAPRSVP